LGLPFLSQGPRGPYSLLRVRGKEGNSRVPSSLVRYTTKSKDLEGSRNLVRAGPIPYTIGGRGSERSLYKKGP
jgi:hypothetical protein